LWKILIKIQNGQRFTTLPIQTKNLTIQIMENKERFSTQNEHVPYTESNQSFTQPLNVLIAQRMSILKGRYYRLSQS
jgi:hypothetical protein